KFFNGQDIDVMGKHVKTVDEAVEDEPDLAASVRRILFSYFRNFSLLGEDIRIALKRDSKENRKPVCILLDDSFKEYSNLWVRLVNLLIAAVRDNLVQTMLLRIDEPTMQRIKAIIHYLEMLRERPVDEAYIQFAACLDNN